MEAKKKKTKEKEKKESIATESEGPSKLIAKNVIPTMETAHAAFLSVRVEYYA